MNTFILHPFNPPPGVLRSPHVQSVFGILRSLRGVAFRRERLTTPDGDFVDLDFADAQGNGWQRLGEKAPIALLLHGLEGSARAHYAMESYRQLARVGIRGVGLNFRGCSGEFGKGERLYHAGETEDVDFVVRLLRERYPDVPLYLVGVSLGANVVLKYLGEQGAGALVRGAAVISPPFVLPMNIDRLDFGPGWVYAQGLRVSLVGKVRRQADTLARRIDVKRALRVPTLQAFDDAVTAPLHGFASAFDYYSKVGSGQFLAGIRVPTLMIRALDDPFFDPDEIPHDVITANPCLTPAFVAHGGHVGFWGWGPGGIQFWAERQVARFLSTLTYG